MVPDKKLSSKIGLAIIGCGDIGRARAQFARIYSGIEWRPFNKLTVSVEQGEKINQILESLDDNDDVQNIFTNYIVK